MQALKFVIGAAIFAPLFVGVMASAGQLADRRHTGLAWIVLLVGLTGLLTATMVVGRLVQ